MKITISRDIGEDLILEFDRRTATALSDSFTLEGLQANPLKYLPILFQGALAKHHSRLKHQQVMEIFDSLKNKSDLIQLLVEMYQEPLEALMDDSSGEVEWSTS